MESAERTRNDCRIGGAPGLLELGMRRRAKNGIVSKEPEDNR
jgi:hypothetical protein